jgi:hypothetical protein
MLGLPSTTEVMRVIPKKAFYEHLKLKADVRRHFVSQIERITLVNSIKPSTMNIADGKKCHEILVLLIELKDNAFDELILEAIAEQNQHPMIMVCQPRAWTSTVYAYRKRLYDSGCSESKLSLNLSASNIDELWDTICEQMTFNETYPPYTGPSGYDLDAKLEWRNRIAMLEHEIEWLEERSRKEKQRAKKNRLHEEARSKRRELERLKAGA